MFFVLQRLHVAEMTDLHVVIAGRTITFAAVVSDFSRDGNVARSANFSTFADGLFLSASLLVVFEKPHIHKFSVAVLQVIRTPENAYGGLAIQSLQVWSHVCVLSRRKPLPQLLNTN
jgi:hypothetical protein